ncbi:MAG: hypothetical protein WCW33_02755 [Candidatus Babeliales bacterium]|jgi:hypothetical protein
MKKLIMLLGMCLMVVTFSKLDAVFAFAVAYDKQGLPNQSAFNFSHNSDKGLVALDKLEASVQQNLIRWCIEQGQICSVSIRYPSIYTGDFTISHGVFAIVSGLSAHADQLGTTIALLGVGVDSKDLRVAVNNAIKDMIANIVGPGSLKEGSFKLLKQGKF